MFTLRRMPGKMFSNLYKKRKKIVFVENAQEMYCKYCRTFPHLLDRKDALTRGTKNLRNDGLKLHDKHQDCHRHYCTCYVSSIGLRNLMIPRQLPAFADTPIGQSLLKLNESQRKRLESLFNTKIR